jgi:hypothetical protein
MTGIKGWRPLRARMNPRLRLATHRRRPSRVPSHPPAHGRLDGCNHPNPDDPDVASHTQPLPMVLRHQDSPGLPPAQVSSEVRSISFVNPEDWPLTIRPVASRLLLTLEVYPARNELLSDKTALRRAQPPLALASPPSDHTTISLPSGSARVNRRPRHDGPTGVLTAPPFSITRARIISKSATPTTMMDPPAITLSRWARPMATGRASRSA